MIEVCYCSPNMNWVTIQKCDYCLAKEEIVAQLGNPLAEFTEDDFDRIFLSYNISPRARLSILTEIDYNDSAE